MPKRAKSSCMLGLITASTLRIWIGPMVRLSKVVA